MRTYSNDEKLEDKFHDIIKLFYKEFEVDGVVVYNNLFVRVFELYNLFKNNWINEVKSLKDRLSNGL